MKIYLVSLWSFVELKICSSKVCHMTAKLLWQCIFIFIKHKKHKKVYHFDFWFHLRKKQNIFYLRKAEIGDLDIRGNITEYFSLVSNAFYETTFHWIVHLFLLKSCIYNITFQQNLLCCAINAVKYLLPVACSVAFSFFLL